MLFAEAPANRRREITSAIAHFIAGVLDGESMAGIIDGMMKRIDFQIGDRVRSLRGSMHGVIVAMEPGAVIMRTAAGTVLRSAEDSLVKEE